jgi:hypothetical protein
MKEAVPKTQELDPRLFTEVIGSVGRIMRTHGSQDLTIAEELHSFGNLDGIDALDSLDPSLAAGSITTLTGMSHGVSYSLEFAFYNEIAGTNRDFHTPMVDIRVTATEGEELWPKDTEESKAGLIRGLIWLGSDRTATADFAHGTRPSTNPTAQAFMNRLVSYFGFEEKEVFPDDAIMGADYDNERLLKLLRGLDDLALQNGVVY